MIRRSGEKISVLPFLAAGYPTLDATVESVRALDRIAGVGAIEIGFPFSDPIADGPVIQEAFNDALKSGVSSRRVFEALGVLRGKISVPLVAMVSYSIVFRYGPERFVLDAKEAGFSGILVPDLPPPEADVFCALVRREGLETVLLVAPTTTPERRQQIVKLCSGFVYYLSVSGVTGERTSLPTDLVEKVRGLKGATKVPVCVGFGIGKREHVEQLEGLADGAIVGSAIVRKMREHRDASATTIAGEVEKLVKTLVG